MGKSYRDYRDHGRRYRNEETADSVNPDNDPYDDVMDIYADKLDANSKNYDLNEGDEDDI